MINYIRNFLVPSNGRFSIELFSGLTVALALIPEAIAFAMVAHVQPQVGLYAAFFMCLMTALFGGRPGMISGATGAMAVVMVALVEQFGVEYLFAAVILTGLLQIICGLFGFGKLIKMMPKPVMIGFVNGLAIVIFLAQLGQFQYATSPGHYAWLPQDALSIMCGLVGLSMLVTYLVPKITKAIPAALIAIALVTLVTNYFGLETRTVRDMLEGATVTGGFPSFTMPNVSLSIETLKIILPYSIILCVIGLSESLMTLTLIDGMTNTKGKANKECIAQGFANVVSGFFKSMGGCAMIGQSMINIGAGARGRLSGISAGIFLLTFLLIGWSMIQMIPLAALIGIMFMVVIGTFEWTTFKMINKVPKHDLFVIALVTGITVASNLAIAVIAGIVIASLIFAWQTAKYIYAETEIDGTESKKYIIHGPLFFASVTPFNILFHIDSDPNKIYIDFKHSRVMDQSAIEAIQALIEKYKFKNKEVRLLNLNQTCYKVLNRATDLLHQKNEIML